MVWGVEKVPQFLLKDPLENEIRANITFFLNILYSLCSQGVPDLRLLDASRLVPHG